MTEDHATFLEEQRLVGRGVALALLLTLVLVSAYLVMSGRMRAGELVGPGAVAGVVFFLYVTRLTIRLEDRNLDVDFHPLVHRTISLSEIAACEARTYRPIREYGGWGIRWGWKGARAYNVRGNRGVHLRLRSGESLLLGSQRHEELALAIRERMSTT